MTFFDDLASALASLAGLDTVTAGFILGFSLIVVLLIAIVWALGDYAKGYGVVIAATLGIVFVVLVGWFPLWVIIFVALIVVFVVVNPFPSSEGA